MRSMRGVCGALAAAVAVTVLAGCGISVPTDPLGTLDRITGGELRAGVSPSDGLAVATGVGEDAEVSGPLPSVIEEFGADREATVTWTVGSEEDLVDLLERGELDLAIGGMTDATPWSERVSVTRGYPDLPGADGRRVVVFVPLGENAMQSAVETYLDREVK